MYPPDLRNVLAGMRVKGYQIFLDPSNKGYNLNLVGVRSAERVAGSFDDWLLVFYQQHGAWQYMATAGTTDPGTPWLEKPMNPAGAAILKPGQYRGLFQIGKHQGAYDALVQATPCTVFRDNNKDNILDTEGVPEETGFFGINLHRATADGFASVVGRHSAGCQVVRDPLDFQHLMALAHRSARRWGNSFTYTLLDEKDVLEDW